MTLFFSGYASFKNIFFFDRSSKLVQMSVSDLFPIPFLCNQQQDPRLLKEVGDLKIFVYFAQMLQCFLDEYYARLEELFVI